MSSPSVSRPLMQTPPPLRSVQHEGGINDIPTQERPPYAPPVYRLYRWRWFMLGSLCLLNISNGMMWLTFSPIPDYTSSYYHVPVSMVDWFSMSFFAASLIMGFLSIYILNKFGLKVSVYAGAIFNTAGGLLRVLSTIEPIICSHLPLSGFVVALIGQVLTACGQPFLLYAPTTFASIWFGTKERALATGLTSLANPIGLAIVQVMSPFIVTRVSRLPMLLLIYAIPAVLSLIMTLIAFWYKAPPTPPTSSSSRDHVPSFFNGIKKILCIPSFLVLLVVWGCSSGLVNALLTILPQILCTYGYTDKESGLWGSLMIFFGMIGATLGGIVLDFTKRFKEVAVVAYSLATLSLIWFYEVFSISGQGVNIAFSLCVFGFFGLVLIPACMELGVEITYPVSEVTSSGLLWSAGQVMGIVIILVGQLLQFPLSPQLVEINQCAGPSIMNDTSVPQCFRASSNSTIPSSLDGATLLSDPTYTITFCVGITAMNFFILVLCLWPTYRRIESEKRTSFEQSSRY